MNLNEITNLIQVRQYLSNSMTNFNIDKSTINDLNRLLVLIDKKIINSIKSNEFRSYVGQFEEKMPEISIKSSIK